MNNLKVIFAFAMAATFVIASCTQEEVFQNKNTRTVLNEFPPQTTVPIKAKEELSKKTGNSLCEDHIVEFDTQCAFCFDCGYTGQQNIPAVQVIVASTIPTQATATYDWTITVPGGGIGYYPDAGQTFNWGVYSALQHEFCVGITYEGNSGETCTISHCDSFGFFHAHRCCY